MSNMLGGDSTHPAYDPRWVASEDEDYVDQILYTLKKIREEWCVVAEDVTGKTWLVDPPTEKLRKRLEDKRSE